MFRLLPVLAALAGSASAQVCPAKYTECPNCCDINNDCRCDSFVSVPQYPCYMYLLTSAPATFF